MPPTVGALTTLLQRSPSPSKDRLSAVFAAAAVVVVMVVVVAEAEEAEVKEGREDGTTLDSRTTGTVQDSAMLLVERTEVAMEVRLLTSTGGSY